MNIYLAVSAAFLSGCFFGAAVVYQRITSRKYPRVAIDQQSFEKLVRRNAPEKGVAVGQG